MNTTEHGLCTFDRIAIMTLGRAALEGDARRLTQHDAGQEVDRLAKEYAAKHKLEGAAGYRQAVDAVLADPDNATLKAAYLARPREYS